MLLCEEYLKRHSIDFNFVRYKSYGCIFFRQNNIWNVFSYVWRPAVHYPITRLGVFVVQNLKPIHNNFNHRTVFHVANNEVALHWDKFENHLTTWGKSQKKSNVVKTKKEVMLVGWEMFSIFGDNQLIEFRDQVFGTLDKEIPIDVRYENLQKFLPVLNQEHPELMGVWQNEVLPYVHNYSFWFSDLVNEIGICQ